MQNGFSLQCTGNNYVECQLRDGPTIIGGSGPMKIMVQYVFWPDRPTTSYHTLQ